MTKGELEECQKELQYYELILKLLQTGLFQNSHQAITFIEVKTIEKIKTLGSKLEQHEKELNDLLPKEANA